MKERNHGFSLVELIVVVAIIGALSGILAPVYLAYVEKTRIQRDESAAGEIFRAAEIVVYTGQYNITDTVLVTFSSAGIQLNTAIANATEVQEILSDHFGNQYQTAQPVSDIITFVIALPVVIRFLKNLPPDGQPALG